MLTDPTISERDVQLFDKFTDRSDKGIKPTDTLQIQKIKAFNADLPEADAP
jgi:hypothetical protein